MRAVSQIIDRHRGGNNYDAADALQGMQPVEAAALDDNRARVTADAGLLPEARQRLAEGNVGRRCRIHLDRVAQQTAQGQGDDS